MVTKRWVVFTDAQQNVKQDILNCILPFMFSQKCYFQAAYNQK
jgi:hypothetical protein